MADTDNGERFTLRRWSQRKLAAAREAQAPSAAQPTEPPAAAAGAPPSTSAVLPPAERPAPPTPADAPPQLPPVETLTFDADFTAFLRPDVDESVKRDALRKLFSDPRFNVMDGLDVYIDDYSKPDPLPEGLARTLAHARYIFEPPATRVTADGHVEDVPPEDIAPAKPLPDDAAIEADGAPPPTPAAERREPAPPIAGDARPERESS